MIPCFPTYDEFGRRPRLIRAGGANASTDGSRPSPLSSRIICGPPSSAYATSEKVVPRSIPTMISPSCIGSSRVLEQLLVILDRVQLLPQLLPHRLGGRQLPRQLGRRLQCFVAQLARASALAVCSRSAPPSSRASSISSRSMSVCVSTSCGTDLSVADDFPPVSSSRYSARDSWIAQNAIRLVEPRRSAQA